MRAAIGEKARGEWLLSLDVCLQSDCDARKDAMLEKKVIAETRQQCDSGKEHEKQIRFRPRRNGEAIRAGVALDADRRCPCRAHHVRNLLAVELAAVARRLNRDLTALSELCAVAPA